MPSRTVGVKSEIDHLYPVHSNDMGDKKKRRTVDE